MEEIKIKLHPTTKVKNYLGCMMEEAASVWYHALNLQRRYHSLYGSYARSNKVQSHFAKRVRRTFLNSAVSARILKHLSQSILWKSDMELQSFILKQLHRLVFPGKNGYKLKKSILTIKGIPGSKDSIEQIIRLPKSLEIKGKVQRLIICREVTGEYYAIFTIKCNIKPEPRNVISKKVVGIDIGCIHYMVMSDGSMINFPSEILDGLTALCQLDNNLKCLSPVSTECSEAITKIRRILIDKRDAFQKELAEQLCEKYDCIFLECLTLSKLEDRFKKMELMAHGDFLKRLKKHAQECGVTVFEIDQRFPSSRLCTCGHINRKLRLNDRQWTCPMCGRVYDRDLHAAKNILKRGLDLSGISII